SGTVLYGTPHGLYPLFMAKNPQFPFLFCPSPVAIHYYGNMSGQRIGIGFFYAIHNCLLLEAILAWFPPKGIGKRYTGKNIPIITKNISKPKFLIIGPFGITGIQIIRKRIPCPNFGPQDKEVAQPQFGTYGHRNGKSPVFLSKIL